MQLYWSLQVGHGNPSHIQITKSLILCYKLVSTMNKMLICLCDDVYQTNLAADASWVHDYKRAIPAHI